MAKLGLTTSEKKVKRRMYTRENRELWKDLGYRMMSTPVHDEDRALVLAELEVRRALRLAQMAEDKATGLAALIQIGRRNLVPPTTPREMREFSDAHRNLSNIVEVEHAVQEANEAYKKFIGFRSNIDNAGDDHVKQRLFAKEVAYGNLAAAWFKLAKVRAEEGVPTTVFKGAVS